MNPPFAITLRPGTSRVNHTGAWRTQRPEYVDTPAPCGHACPAGEDVRAWLADAETPDYAAAWRRIVEVNPFPAIMGRICYHPCETACNRGQLDEAVGINSVERFLGDEALRCGWKLPGARLESGMRILVVGAGPSGLSAAYHLRRLGHAVEIHDGGPRPGGMMRYGIPQYRLPRDVLDAEVERILATGVALHSGSRIDDLDAALREGAFDAVFVAVGAHLARRVETPAGTASKILEAIDLLRDVETGEPPQLGRRVIVAGGGDTAMDAARTAKRLGATDAVIVYRRTLERMPAHPEELEEALSEGIAVRWLSAIDHVDAGKVVVEKMALDETGYPQPTGELEELDADAVVLAYGQDADLGLLERMPGVEIADRVVQVGPDLMTGRPGVFAGGDAVPAERTATTAIGHGRKAAAHIDGWLRGKHLPDDLPVVPAAFDRLNPWYYEDAARHHRRRLDAVRRQTGFEEVVAGLDASDAMYEARRCLSCGGCFGCDTCYGTCPDNAVLKLGPAGAYAYAIDLDFCKGCGICAAECPAGAIEMVPEPE